MRRRHTNACASGCILVGDAALFVSGMKGTVTYSLLHSTAPFAIAVTRDTGADPPLFNTAGSNFVFKVDIVICLPT